MPNKRSDPVISFENKVFIKKLYTEHLYKSLETQRPVVIAQGEENGRIEDAGMDGASEAGNEVMIYNN